MFVTSFYVLSQRIYQGSLMSRLSKTGRNLFFGVYGGFPLEVGRFYDQGTGKPK